jgi:hypothetical protein
VAAVTVPVTGMSGAAGRRLCGLGRGPAGDYVRRYIPELAAVPGPEVHQLWQLLAIRYPRPLAALTSHAA